MLAAAIAAVAAAAAADAVFDVTKFGAVGDTRTDNTVAFRAAAAAAAAAATGPDARAVLLVPGGIFITGAFNLSSFTTLRLAGPEATILGAASSNETAYPLVPPLPSYGTGREGEPARCVEATVHACECERCEGANEADRSFPSDAVHSLIHSFMNAFLNSFIHECIP